MKKIFEHFQSYKNSSFNETGVWNKFCMDVTANKFPKLDLSAMCLQNMSNLIT